MIMEILRQPDINSLDKLKLVILFAIRYEGDEKINNLKEELRKCDISQVSIKS